MNTMYDDYNEDDRWDWDRTDPRQYCRHGSFIGSYWGPDILCADCESMDDDPSLRDMVNSINVKINNNLKEYDGMLRFVNIYIRKHDDKVTDPVFSESIIETTKVLADRRRALEKERADLIEKYEPFCEDGDWDDTNVLYNYHRHLIDEYDKEKESFAS